MRTLILNKIHHVLSSASGFASHEAAAAWVHLAVLSLSYRAQKAWGEDPASGRGQ